MHAPVEKEVADVRAKIRKPFQPEDLAKVGRIQLVPFERKRLLAGLFDVIVKIRASVFLLKIPVDQVLQEPERIPNAVAADFEFIMPRRSVVRRTQRVEIVFDDPRVLFKMLAAGKTL